MAVLPRGDRRDQQRECGTLQCYAQTDARIRAQFGARGEVSFIRRVVDRFRRAELGLDDRHADVWEREVYQHFGAGHRKVPVRMDFTAIERHWLREIVKEVSWVRMARQGVGPTSAHRTLPLWLLTDGAFFGLILHPRTKGWVSASSCMWILGPTPAARGLARILGDLGVPRPVMPAVAGHQRGRRARTGRSRRRRRRTARELGREPARPQPTNIENISEGEDHA